MTLDASDIEFELDLADAASFPFAEAEAGSVFSFTAGLERLMSASESGASRLTPRCSLY